VEDCECVDVWVCGCERASVQADGEAVHADQASSAALAPRIM
jgi:hypothetical protein